jgi:hypothetical protein
MVVPSRREAAHLLLELEPPDWLVRHSAAVAEVAAFIGAAMAERGVQLDRRLAEVSALLHDVDKALPADDPRLRLGHGHAAAAWLADAGFGELSPAVAAHPVTRLADDAGWPGWLGTTALESRVVAYADKRATSELVPMAQRFADWRARYPESVAATDRAEERARELERLVCELAGLRPADIARLPWVDEAIGHSRGAT